MVHLLKSDSVKPITTRDKRVGFVSSDVLYEDFSSRHSAHDNHELISDSKAILLKEHQ